MSVNKQAYNIANEKTLYGGITTNSDKFNAAIRMALWMVSNQETWLKANLKNYIKIINKNGGVRKKIDMDALLSDYKKSIGL